MPERVRKEDWVAMFRDIGLTDEQMTTWHKVFETRHPESHEEFLVWLGISTDEIAAIRAKSK